MTRSVKDAGLALTAMLLVFSLVSPCYAGFRWAPYQSPTSFDLYAVSNPLTGSSGMWAVGREGYVLRFDGASWTVFPRPTDQSLRGVWQVSEDDVWVVGDAVHGVPTMLHWNGTWSPAMIQRGEQDGCPISMPGLNVTRPCGSLNAVMMVNSTYGWAVGDAAGGLPTILTFQDGIWKRDLEGTASTPVVNLYGLQVLPTGEVWAAGENYSAGNLTLATINHRNADGAWLNEAGSTSAALSHAVFRAVAIVGNSVWATGQNTDGTEAVIALFDSASSSWTVRTAFHDSNPPVSFTGVSGVQADDVWFVGTTFSGLNEPLLVHFDGTTMTRYAVPELINYTSGYELNAISMLSESDGWAVGNDGLILRFGTPTVNETTSTTETSSSETSVTTTGMPYPTTLLNLPLYITVPVITVIIAGCASAVWLRRRRRNKKEKTETSVASDAGAKKDEVPRGVSEAHAVQETAPPPGLPDTKEAEAKAPSNMPEIKETTGSQKVPPPPTETEEPGTVKEETAQQAPEVEKTERETHNVEVSAEKEGDGGTAQASHKVEEAREVEEEVPERSAEVEQTTEGAAPQPPEGENLTAAERLKRFVEKSSTG